MQIVEPCDPPVEIADSEVVVQMGADQMFSIKRKQIATAVVTHFVPRIPAKSDTAVCVGQRHESGQVLLSLSVFKRQRDAETLRFARDPLEIRDTTLIRSVILKTDEGVRNHDRDLLFGAGAQTCEQLRDGGLGAIALLPHVGGPKKRSVDRLIKKSEPVGEFPPRADRSIGRPLGKKAVESRLPDRFDQFGFRTAEFHIDAETEFSLVHKIPP